MKVTAARTPAAWDYNVRNVGCRTLGPRAYRQPNLPCSPSLPCSDLSHVEVQIGLLGRHQLQFGLEHCFFRTGCGISDLVGVVLDFGVPHPVSRVCVCHRGPAADSARPPKKQAALLQKLRHRPDSLPLLASDQRRTAGPRYVSVTARMMWAEDRQSLLTSSSEYILVDAHPSLFRVHSHLHTFCN